MLLLWHMLCLKELFVYWPCHQSLPFDFSLTNCWSLCFGDRTCLALQLLLNMLWEQRPGRLSSDLTLKKINHHWNKANILSCTLGLNGKASSLFMYTRIWIFMWSTNMCVVVYTYALGKNTLGSKSLTPQKKTTTVSLRNCKNVLK